MITESSSDFASHADPVAQVLADPACAWILQLTEPLVANATARGPQPLAGLRFAVKDKMAVASSVTTAGCPAFAFKADASAQVVQQLLHAGAALVGKTNLDQFACGLNGTRSPFGAVPNAFNPAYVSGGSSSGSAYVVASGPQQHRRLEAVARTACLSLRAPWPLPCKCWKAPWVTTR